MDQVFHPRFVDNELRLGSVSSTFERATDRLILDNRHTFVGTRGLFELLLMKKPLYYDEYDLEVYERILRISNAHRIGNEPTGRLIGSEGGKCLNSIKELFGDESSPPTSQSGDHPNETRTGARLKRIMEETQDNDSMMLCGNKSNVDLPCWNSADELVDRLELLLRSKGISHGGFDDGINAIIEESREEGYI
ncbi:hypothetical protein QAD02_020698 [Eretmocerus hayati]|uniref:Uncharacterized protein n=1 Tax=Eretmocerus hayati TaxID=131215 RepID=A0ACC2PN95_9HYME|nr:hypothetical protein QAD02_020698 [Eretmocerus hayati]